MFGELFGFIDQTGATVISAYSTAGEFAGGLAPVEVQTAQGMLLPFFLAFEFFAIVPGPPPTIH